MSKVYSFVFLFLITSVTIQAQNKSSVVIKMEPDKDFIYWFSGLDFLSDYEHGFARSEQAKVDNMGIYVKEFSVDKPVVLNLGQVNSTIMTVLPIYLTQGSRDTVTIHNGLIKFKGTNADYNRCLQDTEHFLDYCSQLLIHRPSQELLFTTKSFPEFIKVLNVRKAEAEKKVKRYSGLNAAFIDEQLAHIDLGSRMAFIYKVLFNVPDSLQNDEWKKASKEIVDKPVETPYFPSFREGYFLLSGLLTLDRKVEKGSIEGKNVSLENFERLSKFMEGKNLECAWATLINDDITSKAYDPMVPEMYEMLKERFPGNIYQSFLEAGIAENYRFNVISETDESNKDYQVISEDFFFSSLTDVVKLFKGKVVYVDLWATWCGACLNEFSFLPRVQDSVKELDVVFLYVSMDKPENKTRWEKSFRHYKLKGYHLLATPALTESIHREFGNYIPHAIIFDKDGNIIERNAPGLKQSKELQEKLIQWNE